MMRTKITLSKKSSAAPKNDSEVSIYIKSAEEALWYGEWGKAKHLFEQVLKFNIKNAAAYLGLKLAQMHCKNLDAYTAERKKLVSDKKYAYETLCAFPEAKAKINFAVGEFIHGDIMTANEILTAFYPTLDIDSRIEILEKIIAEEKNFWEEDELLSRAQYFAEAELKEKLNSAHKNISDMLDSELVELQEENKNCIFNAKERKTACLTDIQRTYNDLSSQYQERLTASYNSAVQMQDDAISQYGYQNAAKRFRKLDGFKDSTLRAEECPKKAAELVAEQQAEKKVKQRKRNISVFAILGTVAAAVTFYFLTTELFLPPVNYKKGKAALNSGNYRDALVYFDKAGSYADAVEQSKPLRRRFAPRPTIAAGAYHTVAVRNNGTVAAAGTNMDIWTGQYIGQCDVESWSDIIAVAAGWDHTVGLKADGTVVAVGNNEYGQCNVENWVDIISVAASSSSTIGLKADGTVVAVGNNEYGQCDVEDWKGIIALTAGFGHTIGLKSDGTVTAAGSNKVIINRNLNYYATQIAALLSPTVRGNTGPCEVSDWKNIIAVAAGNEYTIGLKSNGTVVTAGPNRYELNTVENLKNIVAIASGNFNILALKANGKLSAYGPNNYGQRMVNAMNDIAGMTSGLMHTVGIRTDGTVIAIGNNDFGQCNVNDWNDIRLPGHN